LTFSSGGSGLRLYDRITQICDSIDRVQEKKIDATLKQLHKLQNAYRFLHYVKAILTNPEQDRGEPHP
jgi:hypothetical protein